MKNLTQKVIQRANERNDEVIVMATSLYCLVSLRDNKEYYSLITWQISEMLLNLFPEEFLRKKVSKKILKRQLNSDIDYQN